MTLAIGIIKREKTMLKQVLRKKKIPVIYYLGTEKENPD